MKKFLLIQKKQNEFIFNYYFFGILSSNCMFKNKTNTIMNKMNLFVISLIGFMIYVLVEINYIRKSQDMIFRSNAKMLEILIEDIDC